MKQCAICSEILDQHALRCSQGHSVFMSPRRTQTANYLSDLDGNPFVGAEDEPIGTYYALTHACPFCGKRASQGRSLAWIANECNLNGQAIFPCQQCGKVITVPRTIFKGGVLEKLKQAFQPVQILQGLSYGQLLTSDWEEALFATNRQTSIDPIISEWNGAEVCPGCGYRTAMNLSQQLSCGQCNTAFWVNWNDIGRSGDSHVQCPRCTYIMVVPATVWCPNCGLNWRDEAQLSRLFNEANQGLSASGESTTDLAQQTVLQQTDDIPTNLTRLGITWDNQGLTYDNTRLLWTEIVAFTPVYGSGTNARTGTLTIVDRNRITIHITDKSMLRKVSESFGGDDQLATQFGMLYQILLERSGPTIYSWFTGDLAAKKRVEFGNLAIDHEGIWEKKLLRRDYTLKIPATRYSDLVYVGSNIVSDKWGSRGEVTAYLLDEKPPDLRWKTIVMSTGKDGLFNLFLIDWHAYELAQTGRKKLGGRLLTLKKPIHTTNLGFGAEGIMFKTGRIFNRWTTIPWNNILRWEQPSPSRLLITHVTNMGEESHVEVDITPGDNDVLFLQAITENLQEQLGKEP